jgi:hypothetical protein
MWHGKRERSQTESWLTERRSLTRIALAKRWVEGIAIIFGSPELPLVAMSAEAREGDV